MNSPPHFNFLVQFGPQGQIGGFEECSGLTPDLSVVHGRARGPKGSNTLVFKRGVVRAKDFHSWPATALRVVTISLQNERHEIVRTWKAAGASVTKYTSASLNAKGTDVAMDEITLSFEKLDPA